MVLGNFTPEKPVCFLSKHSFVSLRRHTAGKCPQSQVHFQWSLCREALQALTCLQEPRQGHGMAVPSCLIFCLNINRWVNISNFLCPPGCRGFICVREGFRIRASHWGSFQAISSGRLMSCSEITPSSYLACSKGHPTPNQTDWKKQQLSCSLPAASGVKWEFSHEAELTARAFFFHLAVWANFTCLSFPDGLGPTGVQKALFPQKPD